MSSSVSSTSSLTPSNPSSLPTTPKKKVFSPKATAFNYPKNWMTYGNQSLTKSPGPSTYIPAHQSPVSDTFGIRTPKAPTTMNNQPTFAMAAAGSPSPSKVVTHTRTVTETTKTVTHYPLVTPTTPSKVETAKTVTNHSSATPLSSPNVGIRIFGQPPSASTTPVPAQSLLFCQGQAIPPFSPAKTGPLHTSVASIGSQAPLSPNSVASAQPFTVSQAHVTPSSPTKTDPFLMSPARINNKVVNKQPMASIAATPSKPFVVYQAQANPPSSPIKAGRPAVARPAVKEGIWAYIPPHPDELQYIEPINDHIYVLTRGEEVGIFNTWHDVAFRAGYGQPVYQRFSNWATAHKHYSTMYYKDQLIIEPRPNGRFDNPVRIDEPYSSDEEWDKEEEIAFRLGNTI